MSISKILIGLCVITQYEQKMLLQILFTIFSSKKVLQKNKKVCLKINRKQSMKLRGSPIKFKNYFKQLAVPFKIHADFESVLERVQNNNNDNNASYTKKYQKHFSCSFAYKFVYIDDRFSEPVVLHRGKNAVNKFIKAILKEYDYCKEMIKKHNKNLVMFAGDERSFKLSNKCWICNKLFAAGENKVRYHYHVTGKYRDSVH